MSTALLILLVLLGLGLIGLLYRRYDDPTDATLEVHPVEGGYAVFSNKNNVMVQETRIMTLPEAKAAHYHLESQHGKTE